MRAHHGGVGYAAGDLEGCLRHVMLRAAWLLIALGIAALVAACGGDENDTPEPQAQNQPQSEAQADQADVQPSASPLAAYGRVDVKVPANARTSAGEATPAAVAASEPGTLDVERVARAVVRVEPAIREGDSFSIIAFGSGSVVDPDGLILTNYHVIDPDIGYDLLVVAVTTALDQAPEERFIAEVMVADATLDLAVLRLVSDLEGAPLDPATLRLTVLPMGDAASVQVLDRILAFGYPDIGDETLTVTAGSISGFLSQPGVEEPRAWFKTDTTISFGNSGGAAVNEAGELIGVPTQGRFDEGGAIAHLRPISFAIPMLDAARRGEQSVPRGAAAQTAAPIFGVAFGDGISEGGELLGAARRFPAETPAIYYSFSFQGIADGTPWRDRWLLDGEEIAALSESRPPWNAGTTGSFLTGIEDANGFNPGVYTVEFELDGEVVARRSIAVGDVELPRPVLENLQFARGVDANLAPLGPASEFPGGTDKIFAVFDFRDAAAAAEYTATWLHDDEETFHLGPLAWEAGDEGRFWVSLSAARGFPPGAYTLRIAFDGEQAADASVTVTNEPGALQAIELGLGQEIPLTLLEGDTTLFVLPRISIPAGSLLEIGITGTGDADLYARRGIAPSPDDVGEVFDQEDYQAPYIVGSDERVAFPGPAEGDWFLLLGGYDPISEVRLRARIIEAGEGIAPLTPGRPLEGFFSEEVATAEYTFSVPSGTESMAIAVVGNGENDLDLYLKQGAPLRSVDLYAPASGPHVFAPFTRAGMEAVVVQDPTPGAWFVRLEGFLLNTAYTLVVRFNEPLQPLMDLRLDRELGAILPPGGAVTFRVGPAPDQHLTVATGSDDDVDLYVRRGQPVTTAQLGGPANTADLRAPFLSGGIESVIFPPSEEGPYYVTIAAPAGASFAVAGHGRNGIPQSLGFPALIDGQQLTLGPSDQFDYQVVVPEGAERLAIRLSGSGDADLYVRYAAPVSIDDQGFRTSGPSLFAPFMGGSDEEVVLGSPLPGVYGVSVVGFDQSSNVRLNLTIE